MTGAENVQPDLVKIAKLAPAHFAGAHGFLHRPRLSSTNRFRTATACNRRGDLEPTPYCVALRQYGILNAEGAKMICDKCGMKLQESDSRCPECGESKLWVWGVVIVTAMAAIGFILAFK